MIDGILPIYKEKSYTSHDVVARLRGILKQKKIGHTGTLDPDATGVLPVCLGAATRVSDMLSTGIKEYWAPCRSRRRRAPGDIEPFSLGTAGASSGRCRTGAGGEHVT